MASPAEIAKKFGSNEGDASMQSRTNRSMGEQLKGGSMPATNPLLFSSSAYAL
ncbi:MAG: hypothetical protein IKE20_03520 [Eggerthellaceae bacterium]|nr:hypothetical protein [Eggerthellaceae bacterium]